MPAGRKKVHLSCPNIEKLIIFPILSITHTKRAIIAFLTSKPYFSVLWSLTSLTFACHNSGLVIGVYDSGSDTIL
ncbi:hypothetical protein SPONN_889 [uncultured Candidatus Thioglobus sp.]|nr:hypothetical protein SPONN_889 [uncultured Candidatus Thioglobus sp.]